MTGALAAMACATMGYLAVPADEPSREGVARFSTEAGGDRVTVDERPLAREGTTVTGIHGHFRRAGERLVFQPADGARPWYLLENLNLERVARILHDSGRSGVPWSVSGTVTEYRGANYLLLSRAVLKTAGGTPPGRGAPPARGAVPARGAAPVRRVAPR